MTYLYRPYHYYISCNYASSDANPRGKGKENRPARVYPVSYSLFLTQREKDSIRRCMLIFQEDIPHIDYEFRKDIETLTAEERDRIRQGGAVHMPEASCVPALRVFMLSPKGAKTFFRPRADSASSQGAIRLAVQLGDVLSSSA
jgi:hypothetical protein